MTTQLAIPSLANSGATFSRCGVYRYRLWRAWGKGPRCPFVMLNPSTADEEANDPTIRRCIGYAREWGYSGLEVVNIFALRSTDPNELYIHPAPVGGIENDEAITEAVALGSGVAVCAWGDHGAHLGRGHDVYRMLTDLGVRLVAFKVNKSGHPIHPLYQPASLRPRTFRMGWP